MTKTKRCQECGKHSIRGKLYRHECIVEELSRVEKIVQGVKRGRKRGRQL